MNGEGESRMQTEVACSEGEEVRALPAVHAVSARAKRNLGRRMVAGYSGWCEPRRMQVHDPPGSLLVEPLPDDGASARLWATAEVEGDDGRLQSQALDAQISHSWQDIKARSFPRLRRAHIVEQ